MTGTLSPSSDRPRGAARRTALLEATLALVGELGADAVTHRAVAHRAGLPLASTTYWFASKEELLTEALRHAFQRDAERLRARAAEVLADAGTEPPTPAQIIDVVSGPERPEDPLADRGTLLAVYSLMLEAARRPALREISEHWTDVYLTTIGELLHRAGSTRPADDARLLIAACDGLTVDRLSTGTGSAAASRPQLQRLLEALIR